MNAIARQLSPEDILLDVSVSDKAELFQVVGRHMERAHGLKQDQVAASLSRREMAGSTALGQGFAIPHARVHDVCQRRVDTVQYYNVARV